jgi:hypothetical protein
VGSGVETRHQQQEQVYRSYAAAGAQSHWHGSELISGSAAQVAEELITARSVAGADALNLRVHVPGITADEVSQQIDALAPVIAAIKSG